MRVLARIVALAATLAVFEARAERGLFAVSAEAGQSFDSPTAAAASRGFLLVGGCEYGLAERWGLSLSAGGEFFQDQTTLSLSLGPRAVLFQSVWTTFQAFALPELLPSWSGACAKLDLGLRAGLALRYQLLWGLGLSLQGSVRARAEAAGSAPVRFEGLLAGGLFIEA